MFLIALASLGLGAGVNIIAERGWIHDYESVRMAQDDLQKQYRALIDEAKELKINRVSGCYYELRRTILATLKYDW